MSGAMRIAWVPLVLGAVLMLPAVYLAETTPPDDAFPMPSQGKTTKFEVANSGYPAIFGDNFQLQYEVVVDPVTTVDMPQRPPVPCQFRLVSERSGATIATIDQLNHAEEDYRGNVAVFGSDLFEMPAGKTEVALTNLGCRQGYELVGGLGRVGPIGEHLLVPIGAWILQVIGVILIAFGLGISLVRYLGGRRSRAELVSP